MLLENWFMTLAPETLKFEAFENFKFLIPDSTELTIS